MTEDEPNIAERRKTSAALTFEHAISIYDKKWIFGLTAAGSVEREYPHVRGRVASGFKVSGLLDVAGGGITPCR
ncbi:hypothetical protein [Nitrolancea hollandica]|uniref:hypothetical protein n=1 Tax=Nitrolancea hollandica TaxID=1206749 RepID=UPI0012670458|nr:hypothetical protein [Nitrolancea hollandica]